MSSDNEALNHNDLDRPEPLRLLRGLQSSADSAVVLLDRARANESQPDYERAHHSSISAYADCELLRQRAAVTAGVEALLSNPDIESADRYEVQAAIRVIPDVLPFRGFREGHIALHALKYEHLGHQALAMQAFEQASRPAWNAWLKSDPDKVESFRIAGKRLGESLMSVLFIVDDPAD